MSNIHRQSSVVSRQFNKYLTKYHSLQQLCKSFMMLAFAAAFLTSGQAFAAGNCMSVTSGNWSDGKIWSCRSAPADFDPVIVSAGHTVTIDVANAVAESILINGTLTPGANTLTITPVVAATAFVNNGTFNTTGGSRVIFDGNAMVSGSSATVFDNLDINNANLTLPSAAPLASINFNLGGTNGATAIAGTLKFINTFSATHTLLIAAAAVIPTLDLSGLTTGDTIDVNGTGAATFSAITGGTLGAPCGAAGTPIPGTLSACTVTVTPVPANVTTNVVIYSDNGDGNGNHTGNLGGRTGADASCAAAGASKPTTGATASTQYRALISVDAADEIQDMPANYSVPTNLPIVSNYVTTGDYSGTNAIVTNWAALLNGTTLAGTMQVTTGATNVGYWTGSTVAGTIHANNCSGWTTASNAINGRIGQHNNATSPAWINAGAGTCDLSYHLLCIAFTPAGASNTVSAPLFSTKEKAKVFSEEVK